MSYGMTDGQTKAVIEQLKFMTSEVRHDLEYEYGYDNLDWREHWDEDEDSQHAWCDMSLTPFELKAFEDLTVMLERDLQLGGKDDR